MKDLEATFLILREYDMKLNPLKCTFMIHSGKFLGYIVKTQGIKANHETIKATVNMETPNKLKDVMSLNGKVAGLN